MTIRLTPAQTDRACGVLIASAAGDALGAGYEFAHVAPDLVPAMIGGGLGDFAPGEWTDDTSQAVAIARVAATGVDLRTPEALTQIAQGFADWYAGGPADVGIQTSAVLCRAGRNPTGAEMAEAARVVHERSGRSAGNGSLMRTGPVALAYLDDPEGLVEAAMAVSALTHHQDLAQEACAVWCLMIRHAVLHGELPTYDDIAAVGAQRATSGASCCSRPRPSRRRPSRATAGRSAPCRRRGRRSPTPPSPTTGPPAATSSTRSPPRSASATTPTPSPRSPAPCSARGGG